MQQKYRVILVAIVTLAAVVRFSVAPQIGIEAREDTLLFQLWGYSINAHGLTNVYAAAVDHHWFEKVPLPNYLPPYLYILGGVDWLRRHLDPGSDIGTPFASVLLKTIPILSELVTILLLASIVRRRADKRWALLVAAIYALLPPILYNTAAWGQVDAVNTSIMVLCIWFLQRQKLTWASVAFMLAFFVKMQSIVLLPLLLFEVLRTKKPITIVRSIVAAVVTAILVNLPFLVTGKFTEILKVITSAPGSYSYPSANAFNFWWFFSGGHWLARTDTTSFLFLTMAQWGAVIFFAAVGFALWFRYRLRTADSLWLTAAFLAFAFFMLPTEMHERYLFPFFALLIPVLPITRFARWIFGALAVTFTWNLLVALLIITHDRGANAPNELLGGFWGGSLIVASLNVLLFIGTVVWYARMAHQRRVI